MHCNVYQQYTCLKTNNETEEKFPNTTQNLILTSREKIFCKLEHGNTSRKIANYSTIKQRLSGRFLQHKNSENSFV